MLLQCCLNGPRRPGEHPRLPVTPAEQAADVARVAWAVGAVHLHVKGDDGVDTLDPVPTAAVLRAVRTTASGLAVGLSTGAWAAPDPAQRVRLVRSWTVLPDFASVNWHEPGAEEVAGALIERGVGVEAGIWHLDGLRQWLSSPRRDDCLRVLLELPDGLDEAETVREADRLRAVLAEHAADVPLLVHGEGTSCWPAMRYAATHGLATRIGLEDTLVLPDSSPGPDNAGLVQAALAILRRQLGSTAPESPEPYG